MDAVSRMSWTRPPNAGSDRAAIVGNGIWQVSRSHDGVTRAGNWVTRTVRVLGLLALVFVAGYIVVDTTGQRLAVSDPKLALAVTPSEPIALAELAQRQLASTSGDLSSIEDLARRALLSDPLNSSALSSLGSVARIVCNQPSHFLPCKEWKYCSCRPFPIHPGWKN